VKNHLTNIGMIILASSTAEFGQFIDSELTKWGQVIKTGGIKAE
jgi:tripartite-type tricarboxylate transporter receptor subunit TctC